MSGIALRSYMQHTAWHCGTAFFCNSPDRPEYCSCLLQSRKQKKEEAVQEAKAATPVGAVQEAAAAVGSGLEALKASGKAASSGG